jgi:hypothetical protein
LKEVGCTKNEEKRGRDRVVLGREKIVSGSENDNYLGTNFEC